MKSNNLSPKQKTLSPRLTVKTSKKKTNKSVKYDRLKMLSVAYGPALVINAIQNRKVVYP